MFHKYQIPMQVLRQFNFHTLTVRELIHLKQLTL